MTTRETGYETRRDRIIHGLAATLAGERQPLGDVYRQMTDVYDIDGHEVWTGIRELDAAGALDGVEDGGTTHLRLAPGADVSLDDLPGYAVTRQGSREGETVHVAQYGETDWTDTVEGTRVPALDVDLADDFFTRHGWDITRIDDGDARGVSGYRETAGGDKEHRVTVVNDRDGERDLYRVRGAFHGDGDAFTTAHRHAYLDSFWVPLTVLQQRTGWVNRSADTAAGQVDRVRDSRADVRGRGFTPGEAVIDELASLGDAEPDAAYAEARDAVVDAYFTGGTRYSRLVAPFSDAVESRFVDGSVAEGALPSTTGAGREKGPALLQAHLDRVYDAAGD